MDRETRRVLRLLREIGRTTKLTGRVRLRRAYLRAVMRLEALPCNRSGADKTWVHEILSSFRRHFRLVRNARA
jgi:hypothetical protein